MAKVVEGAETRTVIAGDTVTQTVHERVSSGAVRRRDRFERLAGAAPLHTARNGRVRSYPWRGEDLIILVERLGPSVTPEDVRTWCSELCRACAELHSRGIVHGDIKPDNVCVHPRTGDVALIDFGAAMRIADEGMEWLRGRDPRRAENAIVGTDNYTVPRKRAKQPVDIDYYATGRTIAALQGALPARARDGELCRIGRELEACGERASAAWQELAALVPRGSALGVAV